MRRLEQGVSIAEAARALEVSPNVLHRWRQEFRQAPGNTVPGNGKARWSEARIAELERPVGQQALEIDCLKGCLPRPAFTSSSTLRGTADFQSMPAASAARMVELGRVSRSGLYRSGAPVG